VFQSERFFREAWPQISQSVATGADAASDVRWIAGATGLEPGARVLDAPCGFGRHSVEFARRDCETTGVDFSETELGRGAFVVDTRNRDQCVRSLPPEERMRRGSGSIRVENEFDPTTSRWRARWWRLKRASAQSEEAAPELIGESEIRLYSAHELLPMLRPERWRKVELFGGLDGTPFSLDSRRLVVVAQK